MGFFSDTCPACGGKVRRGASFCPHCGSAAPKARFVCPACGREVRASAKFCTQCGAPIKPAGEEAEAVDRLNRWRRAEGEFARRVEAADLQGMLRRGLVVEPGTQALIFQGGALAEVVPPGTYDLNRPLAKVDAAVPATAILIDAGDVALSLGYIGLRTREDVAVNASVDLVMRLADAAALYTNLMHGRQSLTTEALLDLLRAETLNVIQARVKQVSVKDLPGNTDLKTALESDLKDGLAKTLARTGLELVQLRFLDFYGDAYAEVRKARGETFVAEEMAAESERRAALNKRIRETLTKDRMDKFASAKDLEDFIRQTEHELGMKEVIRETEMADLRRTYEAKREDAEIARRHLLEKLDLEHSLALRRMQRTGEVEELDHQVERERKALAARQQAEWEQAQQRKKIADLERDTDVADARAGIDVLREMQAAKAEAKRADQQIEIDRIAALSELGTEALIAGSDAEKAALIAGLKKTEMLKDYSEEQILAMAAEKSPAVAEAFKEKFRAMGGAEVQQQVNVMYEKMLAEQKEAAGSLTEVQREHAKMLQELFQQTLAVQGRVASAAAGSQRPQVVMPPAGGQPTVVGPIATVTCPKCRAQTPPARFCEHCGAALQGA